MVNYWSQHWKLNSTWVCHNAYSLVGTTRSVSGQYDLMMVTDSGLFFGGRLQAFFCCDRLVAGRWSRSAEDPSSKSFW